MTKTELIELCLDWSLSHDDKMCYSDVTRECVLSGFDFNEIQKEAKKVLDKLNYI